METGKREIQDKRIDLKNRKKKRLKKLIYWLIIDLSVAFIIISLLLYKPGNYEPIVNDPDFSESSDVSSYLTELTSYIYNNAQLNKPFEVEVTQEALNDMITKADWPKESQGVMLYAPAAIINNNLVVFMGTAVFQGVEFIITIEIEPKIKEDNSLLLDLKTVKIGVMNITPLAKLTAQKMYAEKLSEIADSNNYEYNLQSKIIASLLSEEPFEPVFEIENDKIRINKINIEQGKFTVFLIPEK